MTAFIMFIIWNNSIVCYLIATVNSLLIGIVFEEMQKVIPLIIVGYVVSAVMAVLAYLSPAFVYGGPSILIDIGILGSAGDIIVVSFIALPLCIFIGFLGCSIGERI
jgi:hypothetical protein